MTGFILFTYFILTHWVSDFVLQTPNMSLNKSKSNYWLTLHILTYTSATIAAWFILFLITGMGFSMMTYVFAFALIFAMHWVTDYITSRMTSKLYAKKDFHNFFVVIGGDQILHYIQIFLTLKYIFSITIRI